MASAGASKVSASLRGHRRTVSTDIIERARLEVLVPDSTRLDIYEYLSEHGNTSAAAALKVSKTSTSKRNDAIPSLASVAQRQALFYDEDVPVYIALQIIGIQDDAVYESYSSRLAVSLEVTAIENIVGKKQDSAAGSKQAETPVLLFQKTIQDKDSGRISWRNGDVRIAVWKLMVPLGHPKVKTANPRVVFSASATLRFLNQVKSLPEDEYITSRQTLGVNLLETFSSGLACADDGVRIPYLSAARVSRVPPLTPTPKETFSPLGYSSKKQFPILPALNFKMRGSRLSRPKGQELLACLHLEVTSYAGCKVRIDDVELNHQDGKASLLTGSTALSLPLTLLPKDEIMLLFSLATPITPHHATPSPSTSPSKQVNLKLSGEVLISDVCRPTILTHWDTIIDFSSPSQHSAAAGNQNAQRVQPRGPTISVPSTRPITPNSQVQLAKTGPHDVAVQESVGLSITFTGPPRVHVGELFSWQVFVVNRSSRSRKLALIIPPKRRKGDGKVLPSPPQGTTEPVLDESVLYTTYKGQYLEPAELVPLVNDVKIGPLAPNACHNAELRFMALATGVLHVEGVRVVDLANNEITDCRDLPSVICVGKS